MRQRPEDESVMLCVLVPCETRTGSSSVDPGQVSARCDKGVLNINLAKKAEAKPTQIKVNAGGEKSLEAIAAGKAV
jgi:hypothetical protein